MKPIKLIKIERYESSILEHLNNFLRIEVYNKDLLKATFTYCRLSQDSSSLKIFVDTFNREELDKIIFDLNKFKGLFRSEIAKSFNFRVAPTISFLRDKSIDRVNEIEDILSGLKGN